MRHAAPRRPFRERIPVPVPDRRALVAAAVTAPLVAAPLAALPAAALAATPSASHVTCAPVAIGSSGPAVAAVQRVIGTTPDGLFGPLTERALRGYQRHHALPATGAVDAATWRALPRAVALAACGAPVHGAAPWCPTLAYGSIGPDVAVLQRAVGATPDGDFGPLTEAAVRATQRRLHLPATGTVEAADWAALHLSDTPACTSATGPRPAPAPVAPTLTVTPVSAPAPPADAAAQQAVHAQVLQLVRELGAAGTAPASPVAAPAIAFALAQRGKPYVYGGTGPAGYDCSGLMLASYRAAGLTLLRTAAEQYTTGVAVPLNELQPGDIVFYAADLTDPRTIYHDALYIGNGTVVNAPYTGEVVRTEPLWTSGLLPTAMRPAAALKLPLAVGDAGWSVRQLQLDLTRAGFPLTADGAFGPLTAGGVRTFQSAAHLPVTGTVDLATWQALTAAG